MSLDRKSAASSQPAHVPIASTDATQPLISFSTIDAPSQRFYAVSIAVLIQAWKYASIIRQLFSSSTTPSSVALHSTTNPISLSTAVFLNFAVLFLLSRLGIPLLDPRLASARLATPAHNDPKNAVLQSAKTAGLTYAHYLAIFVALSFTDATLIGSESTNPMVFILNGLLNILHILTSVLGLSVPTAGLFPDMLSRQLSINEGHVRIRDLIQPKSHILGQHTIHILPHSTAKLMPSSACYCVGPDTPQVTVPVLFSNAQPDLLQYSITGFATGHSSYYNVSVDNLIPFGASSVDRESDELSVLSAAATSRSTKQGSRQTDLLDDEDALDDPASLLRGVSYAERARIRAERRAHSLGKRSVSLDTPKSKRTTANSNGQQLLWHLPVTQPGRIRLERVLDKSRNDARISTSEALVVQCPSTRLIAAASTAANLMDPLSTQHKCPGDRAEFAAQVSGVAPLELEYRRIFDPLSPTGASSRYKDSSRQDNTRKISRISPPHHTSPLLLPEAEALLSPTERLALARERTRAASRRNQQGSEDFSWAVSVDVDMPLSTIDLELPGNYTYALESVTDACGNRVAVHADRHRGLSLTQKARKKIKGDGESTPTYKQSVVVHSRRSVAFDAQRCRPGHPLPLLRNVQGIDLNLQSSPNAEQSGDWNVSVTFHPDNSAANKGLWARDAASASTMRLTLPAQSSRVPFAINKPGTYRIDDIVGPFCPGEVGTPWTCEVVDVPPPTAQIKFSSIEDRCAGPVGVKAMSVLTGTPPFQLEYEVTKQGRHPERKVRTIFDQTRDELDFRPDVDGAVTYKFVKLHDSNYRGIPLDGPSFTQVFHPLSSAEFTAPIRQLDDRAVMQSCSGKQAEADVRFSGAGPWDLTYAVRAGDSIETKVVEGITQSPHKLKIDIPKSVAASGGLVTVSLVKIRDARGCEKSLATRDLNVEVRRVQPSVGFLPIKADKGRHQEVLFGKGARLPIRLSGQGPWHVNYSWKADESAEEVDLAASLHNVDAELMAEHPGTYRIKRIRDNYCPGTVLKGQEEYRISVRPQPHVQFATDAGVAASNGSLIRAPVCRGQPDSVDIVMSGQFPVDVEYEHIAPSWSASSEPEAAATLASAAHEVAMHGKRRKTAFTSALGITNLELSTALPGWHTYVLNTVGDSVYAPSRLQDFSTESPRRLEQMILPLPGASFASKSSRHSRPSLCLGDGLDRLSSLPVLKLQGQAPFTITFEVASSSSPSAGAGAYRFTRSGIKGHEYKLDLSKDEFAFSTKGLWSIRVMQVTDANNCQSAPVQNSYKQDDRAMVIEVTETADIAAVSAREDYCIGEMVEFALQGSPPWTVSYEFNGKTARAAVNTAEFSRVAEKPGVLAIKSVAHQQNQCRRDIDPRISQDMVKTIHDLPTVRISEGNHFVEDLREGNQAEIIFSFKGVPPFSFTYQRSEPVDTHARPKVLETNTVSGIIEETYSIWAAVEGTWSVTWLQDRWCQVSLDYHSGAATPLGKSRLAIKNEAHADEA
ncbi:probable Nuclear pore membrane protein [Melanopsichium pennsylvanicum]|uniref:Nuclear pore membrane protein n=2 Tax=Melanopsichium pennsylvanicum TaxID=63383 RepID=A0A077QWT6_9BASI|nr:nuclear pore membrane protein [Melanopsichium pennsylvanicum 4]SNX85770.1 probable Nuclear pore membrane protein [Melanopsichium pennsylvanicum]